MKANSFHFCLDGSCKQCWTKHVQKSFPTQNYKFIARPDVKFKRVRKNEKIYIRKR